MKGENIPPKNRPSLNELLSAPEPIYKENQESEEPLLTDEQFELLKRCLKLYYKACKLINEGGDWSDTSGEQEDLLELANTLEKIFGEELNIYYD